MSKEMRPALLPSWVHGIVKKDQKGFSLLELALVIAVFAVLATMAIPQFAGYLGFATVREGTREIQEAVGRAKQLAINTNQAVCFAVVGGGYQFQQGGCGGPPWVGPFGGVPWGLRSWTFCRLPAVHSGSFEALAFEV